MDRSPNHCRVKVRTPGIIGSDNRILLFEACDVLTTGIDAPMTEETGDLCTQLFVTFVTLIP